MNKMTDYILFDQYSKEQRCEIWDGLDKNLDVQKYADPRYTPWQMWKIRETMEMGLDVTIMCNPDHDEFLTTVLQGTLIDGFDCRHYLDQGFSAGQINELRAGAKSKVAYLLYANKQFNEEQMCTLREALEKGQDVAVVADPRYSAESMRLILCAHQDGKIDVKAINHKMSYDDLCSHVNSFYR